MAQLPQKTTSLIRLEESSDDRGTKRLKHAPALDDRISALPDSILLAFSPLCPLKALSKQAFYLKDGPIFGPSLLLSVSQILHLKMRLSSPLP